MKAIVIFQSKYGATKKYAQWLAEALSCESIERKNVKPDMLEPYDTIIYGGGLYAGGVSGIELISKNFDKISDKNLVLFTCGLADPSDSSNVDSIKSSLNKALTAQMQEKIKIFHLRGAVDYSKLSLTHRSMMAMLHKIMLKKDPAELRNEDKEMLETYGQKVDFTNEESIKPILEYLDHLQ